MAAAPSGLIRSPVGHGSRQLRMKEWIPVISLVLSIPNLVFVSLGVWFIWLQIRKASLWNRRKYTLDEIARWDDVVFRQKRKALNNVADPFEMAPGPYQEVAENLTIDHLDTVRQVLNYFDSLGAGIRFGLLDDRMCHETLGINVDRYFNWAKLYLLEMRKIEPRAWEEIDTMLLRWTEYDKARKMKGLPEGYKPV